LSDTETSYFGVVAYNGEYSELSYIGKNTPNRQLLNTISLDINPQNNQRELKYTVYDDSGNNIIVERSSNLTLWESYGSVVLEGVEEYSFWIPLNESSGFFRVFRMSGIIPQNSPLFLVNIYPDIIDEPEQKIYTKNFKPEIIRPHQRIPKRIPKSHENISRKTRTK